MKRNINKALAILMALALVMSLAAMSASAATTYTAIPGTTTSFDKEFAIPDGANMPNVEFEYTISEGTAKPISATNEIEILAGPVVRDPSTNEITAPTVEKAVFPSSDTTGTDDSEDSTKTIYVDEVGINLTGVTFNAPGVYRYVITEKTDPTVKVPGVTYDDPAERYLDVFVFPSEADPTVLEVREYAMTKNGSSFTKTYDETNQKWIYTYSDPDDQVKSSGYKNILDTVDLEFTKDITGNQADQSKKFTFTLSITGANPNQEYAVEITGTDVIIAGSGVTEGKITTDANGAYTGTFELTKGDIVKVLGLPVGATYTVTEEAEDYESDDASVTGYTDPTTGTFVKDNDVKTSYTNSREGIIPTGVILTVAPFMIGLLLFGAVMMFMISRRRRATY